MEIQFNPAPIPMKDILVGESFILFDIVYMKIEQCRRSDTIMNCVRMDSGAVVKVHDDQYVIPRKMKVVPA